MAIMKILKYIKQMRPADRDAFLETMWLGTALIAVILIAALFAGCATAPARIDYTPVSTQLTSAKENIRRAEIVLTNCNPETLSEAQLQLDSAKMRISETEKLLRKQADEVRELEKMNAEIPQLKLKIAEQRGTIWKLILITSGVVLGMIGIFIFRQALLNVPVIGWLLRLIGL